MNPFRCALFPISMSIDVCAQLRALISILLVFAFLFSAGAMAGTPRYSKCQRDGITRLIVLVEQSPNGIPCQVMYYKPQEDQSSSRLWYAKSELNFCHAKYEEFLVKLETNYGWDCRPGGLSLNRQTWEYQVEQLAEQISKEALLKAPPVIENSATIETLTEGIARTTQAPVSTTAISDINIPVYKSISHSRNDVAAERTNDSAQFGDDIVLNFEEVKTTIPSAIYFFDSAGSRTQAREDCPADGHYLWNTQDPERPVFEMGLGSEFPRNSESPLVQRDANGTLSLVTQSMTLRPRTQTTKATTVAPRNNGIDLEIRETSSGSAQTTICRYLRG